MEEYDSAGAQQYFSDINALIRNLEEKQRMLKERTLLIGKNLVEERSKIFEELQDLKRESLKSKEENLRMKGFIQRMSEQISGLARKEELMMLQRQFDIFKPHLK